MTNTCPIHIIFVPQIFPVSLWISLQPWDPLNPLRPTVGTWQRGMPGVAARPCCKSTKLRLRNMPSRIRRYHGHKEFFVWPVVSKLFLNCSVVMFTGNIFQFECNMLLVVSKLFFLYSGDVQGKLFRSSLRRLRPAPSLCG